MAESTLRLKYSDFVREIHRTFGLGSVYSTGTIAIASGVVTLTSGIFPSWSAAGTVSVGGSLYKVNTRDGNTQVTLVDTSVTVSSTSYVLMQADEEDAQGVEDAIRRGLRRFYNPPPLIQGEADKHKKRESHQWSFLNPVATLSLTNADFDYDLPDDFGQDMKDVTYAAASDNIPLAMISERELRALQSRDAASAAPKYYCVRPKATFAATDGQRFEVLVYPTPSGSLTLTYNYNVAPNALTPAAQFPYGGAVHAETILVAMLAAAEEYFDSDYGYGAKFTEMLAASIALDSRAGRVETTSYRNTAVTLGTYDWLAQEVGNFLAVGPNPEVWTHDVQQRVDSVIQQGINEFYMPANLGGKYQSHTWSFLRPATTISTVAAYATGTVTIVDGVVTLASGTFPSWAASGEITVNDITYSVNTRDSNTQVTLDDTTVDVAAGTAYTLAQNAYDLPADFGGIDGPMTYQPGSSSFYPPLQKMPETDIRIARQHWLSTSRPVVFAVRVKTPVASTGTRWEILFYPSPDSVYQLSYRYKVKPAVLTTGNYPLGGVEHSQTILASCLSVASGGAGPARERFVQLLAASVEMDQMESGAETLGINSDWREYAPDGASIGFHSQHVTFNGVRYS